MQVSEIVPFAAMRGHFLESEKGRLLAFRKRKKRIFRLWWSGPLQSKRSATAAVNADFQKEVIKAMDSRGRRGPFTGPLMLDVLFSAGTRNAPEVHSLAKHYLDLLQWPVSGVKVPRKRILVRDDAQIEFLSCGYDNPADNDGVYLRVRRLSDFAEDLELYNDLKSGTLDSEIDLSDRHRDELEDDSAVESYYEFQRGKQNFIERFSQAAYHNMEFLYRRLAQEAILSNRRLGLRSIATLLRPRFDPMRRRPEMASLFDAGAQMTRWLYEQPFMSVDFGARAVRHGESKEFKERVREGLSRARDRNPVMHPLLVPCGVTVLYLPPRHAEKIDLDNLMREAIIPSVHEILQPPATPRDFIVAVKTPDMDDRFAEMLEEYERAPKFHVTGYQVMCIPRSASDPESGNVRLVLHAGNAWRTAWQELESALEEWQQSID